MALGKNRFRKKFTNIILLKTNEKFCYFLFKNNTLISILKKLN